MRFKKIFVMSSCVAALGSYSGGAFAQSTDSPELNGEVISIGIKQSLSSALDKKRAAANIKEIIEAEDVGKLPDDNLAEVLENITGVQISRDGGVGTSVSIRGADRNNVEINGRSTVPSGTNRGGISFDDLPSSLIKSVEVTKVPTADQIEGSIGGTVNLQVFRGLALKKPLATLNAQGVYSEVADRLNPSISATLGNKFSTSIGDIGLVASGNFSELRLQESNLRSSPAPRTFIDAVAPFGAGGQEFVDVNSDGVDDIFFRRGFTSLIGRESRRERNAFTGSAEWQTTDNLKLFAEGSYTDFTVRNLGTALGLPTNANSRFGSDIPAVASGEAEFRELDFGGQQIFELTSAELTNVTLRPDNQSNGRRTETFVGAFGGEWSHDLWSIDAEVSYSDSDTFSPNLQTILQFQREAGLLNGGQRQTLALDFDSRGDEILLSFVDGQVTEEELLDPARYAVVRVRSNISEFDNSEWAQRVDFTRDLDFGFFRSLSFGARLTQRQSERRQFGTQSGLFPQISGADIADILTPNAETDFFAGLNDNNYPQTFLTVDPLRSFDDRDAILETLATAAGAASVTDFIAGEGAFDAIQGFDIEEDTKAFYALTEIESDISGIPLTANLGVRVVETSQTSNGVLRLNGVDSEVATEQSYTDVLPSFNVNLFPRKDTIFRIGFARNIQRPNFDELSSTISFPGNASDVRGGNPNLQPESVTSLDFALEHYFGDVSFISAGYFTKSRSDIITSQRNSPLVGADLNDANACEPGIFNPIAVLDSDVAGIDPVGQCVSFISPVNADDGKLRGWEFALQYGLSDHFEGWYDGFGVIANLTLQDGDRDATFTLAPQFFTGGATSPEFPLALTGLSRTAYNITLFYEKYGFSARARYTWRDSFQLEDFNGAAGGLPAIQESRGQLNMSASYNITDNIAVSVSATDVFNDLNSQRSGFDNGPVFRQLLPDRRFSAGIRFKL